MKKSDLGVVMIHWPMVAILLGTVATGILLWDKQLQPRVAFLFEPANMGVIHIGLSVAVVAILLVYLLYLKHKNFLAALSFKAKIVIGGQVQWKRVNIMLYWMLLAAVVIETITGVLLTKLIDHDVLSKVFHIDRVSLLIMHLYFVLPIIAFPIMHVMIHMINRRVLVMFRPQVFSRRPSMTTIMARLKEENVRLRKLQDEMDNLVSRR